MSRSIVGTLLVAAVLALAGCPRQPVPPPAEAAKTKSPAAATTRPTTRPTKINITIGKDTTYITGPVNADGTINYVAYINAKHSKGVTPQNNAAVLLARAIDPKCWDDDVAARFFKLMGTLPPSAKGDYFVPLDEYIEQTDANFRAIMPGSETASEAAERLLDRTTARPWSERDFPLVSRWLKANAKPLALVESASKCSHIYLPLIPLDDPPQLVTAKMSSAIAFIGASRALVVRAMLRSSQGRFGPAWADLMAARRLARLISRGIALLEALIGMDIEHLAWEAGTELITGGTLSPAQGRKCLVQLKTLAPLPDIRHTIAYERFACLDTVMMLARGHSLKDLRDMFTSLGGPTSKARPDARRLDVDWDEALRVCNAWYDRLHASLQIQDPRQRQQACRRFDDDVLELYTELKAAGTIIGRLKFAARKAVALPSERRKQTGRDIGRSLVSLMMPSIGSGYVDGHEEAPMRSRLLHVAVALALQEAETGRFPAKLTELAPKHLKAVPTDRFSGKALVYKREGNRCVVYSVGENLKDDGGINNREDEDVERENEKDDIVIRFKR